MNISWNDVEQQQWDGWHADAGAPLQQHWAYGTAMSECADTIRPYRAVVSDGTTVIAQAQFLVRQVCLISRIALCSRGPVWLKKIDPSVRVATLNELKRSIPIRSPKLAFIAPDGPTLAPTQSLDLHQVMTGYSTVRIDLTQTEESLWQRMHGKWRNRLVAAQVSPLRVTCNGTKPNQYQWLLEREGLQRQQRAYWAMPASFVTAYQRLNMAPNEALLTMRADIKKTPAAAMMFLIHGKAATYHIGWTGTDGRQHNAHNLLLWDAMRELKRRGIRALDLGGVNTQRGAGIARFKIGSGGDVQTFSGTFC